MLTSGELAAMRAVQGQALMDTCTLRTYAPGRNEFGEETPGWTERAGVPCGLDVDTEVRFSERRRADGTVYVVAAVLRLSLSDGVGLRPQDMVVITHRNGEALNPVLTYGVDGPVRRGPTGCLVALVEVR